MDTTFAHKEDIVFSSHPIDGHPMVWPLKNGKIRVDYHVIFYTDGQNIFRKEMAILPDRERVDVFSPDYRGETLTEAINALVEDRNLQGLCILLKDVETKRVVGLWAAT